MNKNRKLFYKGFTLIRNKTEDGFCSVDILDSNGVFVDSTTESKHDNFDSKIIESKFLIDKYCNKL